MKNRFLESSFKGFSPHEVLEFVLFFSIPQGNVNPLAHILIDRFGSVSGVCNADIEDLKSVDGIGDHSAIMLKMLPDLFRYMRMEKYNLPKGCLRLDNSEVLGDYLTDYFIGETVEKAIMLLLDENKCLIETVEISDGTKNVCAILKSTLIDNIYKYKARSFVLAHNHPDGNVNPSIEDRTSTIIISNNFRDLGVPLAEHYVVAGKYWYAILAMKSGSNTKDDSGTFD